MLYYISCSDYLKVIHETRDDADAPAVCDRLEVERNDGYRVLARRDGRLVADAEGWWNLRDTPDEFDLACERKHDYYEAPEDY